jgi:hypothetical protein
VLTEPRNDSGRHIEQEITMATTPEALRNGVDTVAFFATIDAVKHNPAMAAFQFRASNQWICGTHSRSTMDGFHGALSEMQHAPVTPTTRTTRQCSPAGTAARHPSSSCSMLWGPA